VSEVREESMKRETRLVHAGRDPEKNFGVVNPPVYRTSNEAAVAAMPMKTNRGER
jgi:cystathionine beta-lyase/cystathionine gamma-synthase